MHPITDQSFGVVPVHHDGGHWQFLLVQHKSGHWGFPKGHPEPDESPTDTARRELAEETGIQNVRLVDQHPIIERYSFTRRSGQQVDKTVTYFLGFVDDPAVTPCEKELRTCAWTNAHDTHHRLTFDEGRHILAQAQQRLTEVNQP